jgi:NTP pyrophosphatase (non-canonical NTP hydrolase)
MENDVLRDYQSMCKRTAKTFDDKEKEIACWGLGIAGEAGDIAGCIKKSLFHKNDQEVGIRENVGDTMWYLMMICNYYGWDIGEILEENIDKLKKRFPEGFSEENAKRGGTRVDWMEK